MILSWHQRGPQLPPQVQSISLADFFSFGSVLHEVGNQIAGTHLETPQLQFSHAVLPELGTIFFCRTSGVCSRACSHAKNCILYCPRKKNIAMRSYGGKAPQPPTNPNAPDSRPPPPPQHPPNNRPNPHHHQAIIRVPFENLIFEDVLVICSIRRQPNRC